MAGFEIVSVETGAKSIRSLEYGQTFHPATGPMEEAVALHVVQQRLVERAIVTDGGFVIWDVGLGAAANAIAAIEALQKSGANVRIHSFDKKTDSASFALQHAADLGYLVSHEQTLGDLVSAGHALVADQKTGSSMEWRLHLGDFRDLLQTGGIEAPHAILYDPYSPAANPEMWTLQLLAMLRKQLDDRVPCLWTNYTRSTAVRVTLLLAGFFVGEGHGIGPKEMTTSASNDIALIERPLDMAWLKRVERSTNSAPLREEAFSKGVISAEDFERLKAHPQFTVR